MALLIVAGAAEAQTTVLDDFETLEGWRAAPADGVKLAITQGAGFAGSGMRLDYDFQGHAGWAIARKSFPLDLPENWEFSFRLGGQPCRQTIEFKLLDPSGENVWWSVRRDFQITAEWQRIVVKKRHVTFAWGPAGGGEIRNLGTLEIAIVASEGGAGSVWLDDLTYTPRPPPHPYTATPVVTASSAAEGREPALATDGLAATLWRPAPGAASPHWLTIDFGERRELGGLIVDWDGMNVPQGFEVQTSEDGAGWTTVGRVNAAHGIRSYVSLPEADTRWLRLVLHTTGRNGVGLREAAVQPIEFTLTPNDFIIAIAKDARRGLYPRAFLGEMTSWTLVGSSPGGAWRGLLSADGAFEPAPRSYSLEPFVWLDGRLVTWADVTTTQTLLDGHLPIPTVAWTHPRFTLEITAVSLGAKASQVGYRLTNRTGAPITPRLFVALRPFQVNPPTQFLNAPGGVITTSPAIDCAPFGFWDNWPPHGSATWLAAAVPAPDRCGVASLDGGDIAWYLRSGLLPEGTGWAATLTSAALQWDHELLANESFVATLTVPFEIDQGILHRGSIKSVFQEFSHHSEQLAAVAEGWRERLSRVGITVPAAGREHLDTLRASEAYMLINRDGPALQPGARSYRRSWIRDGAMMAAALLRLGHEDEVKAYARWFSAHQYPDGKVPCCVDARGADPVPENDADGELIFLVAETTRLTGDTAFAAELWPHVAAAIAHLDTLRAQRRTEAYRTPEKLVFYGLMPESISHEGYSTKPMHSYWDDFWALRGYTDAAALAAELGEPDEAARIAASRDELRADLLASIERAMAAHGIDYIPGCAELGDFDATSTTVALAPTAADAFLPPAAVERTFEKYWENFVARRDAVKPWENYTPYELRTVGTFVRLGWRDRAHELLDFFLADRMPPGWRQWPEIVWHDRKTARFLGDLPHTWVGSDYVRSFLDMLAWERERDGALVIAAGVPAAWLGEGGVGVRDLRTRWGRLTYTLREEVGAIRFSLAPGLRLPPGGVVLRAPLAAAPMTVTVNGAPATPGADGEVGVRTVPAEVVIRLLGAGGSQ
ncbi:MAG: discoidin domain-containing protein [Acidobacteria bacterium]|nr:discoidin domain-containing protein [Acidobacteriota bacterium]